MLLPLAVGCARVTRSPAPRDVRTIIVLPVDDRTGSALYADAPPLLAVLRGNAALVAPDGRVLWTCHVPATPIDGGAASSVTLAYPQVARSVAQLVLRDLTPADTSVAR